MHIMENSPQLPQSIAQVTNQSLGSFLRENVGTHVKNILVDTNPKDGLGILQRSQQIYAPTGTLVKPHPCTFELARSLSMTDDESWGSPADRSPAMPCSA